MHLHRNRSASGELPIHAIRPKHNVAKLRALQHVLVHLLVATRISALPGRRVRHNFAASLAVWFNSNRAALQHKSPVHGVHRRIQRIVHLALRSDRLPATPPSPKPPSAPPLASTQPSPPNPKNKTSATIAGNNSRTSNLCRGGLQPARRFAATDHAIRNIRIPIIFTPQPTSNPASPQSPPDAPATSPPHAPPAIAQTLSHPTPSPESRVRAIAAAHPTSASSRAINAGRRANRRCAASYRDKSPRSIASANAIACRNPSANPSPVIASTLPEASPTNATFPHTHMSQFPRHRNCRRAHVPSAPPLPIRRANSGNSSASADFIHPAFARKRRHTNLIRAPPASHTPALALPNALPENPTKAASDSATAPRTENLPPFCRSRIESRPRPHARPNPIRTNNPSRPHKRAFTARAATATRQRHAIPRNPRHRRIPKQLRAATHRPLHQLRVQRHAPHPHPAFARESRRNIARPPDKSHAAHRLPVARANADSQLPQRRNRLRHQPFAARLLNRPPPTIRHHHAKALLPRGNCSRKPSRASADHKHVSLLDHSVSCPGSCLAQPGCTMHE